MSDIDIERKSSHEERVAFMARLAQVTALLFVEYPGKITEFEPNREIEFGVSNPQFVAAVQLKNAMVRLFKTMADSLIWVKNKDLHILVTDAGDISEPIMKAISFRFDADMTFPEFSIPLATELKNALSSKEVVTKFWHLVNGEGKIIYFQAIGEKQPACLIDSSKESIVVNLFDDQSS